MPTVTESDLKEIKDLVTNLTINQVKMEERLSGQINALDEKVSEIDKRLDIIEGRVNSLTGWLIGILFAFVGGLLCILGKIAFFPNP
jgi:tetrahydromethanopterin S-methyltransferase subunit G